MHRECAAPQDRCRPYRALVCPAPAHLGLRPRLSYPSPSGSRGSDPVGAIPTRPPYRSSSGGPFINTRWTRQSLVNSHRQRRWLNEELAAVCRTRYKQTTRPSDTRTSSRGHSSQAGSGAGRRGRGKLGTTVPPFLGLEELGSILRRNRQTQESSRQRCNCTSEGKHESMRWSE